MRASAWRQEGRSLLPPSCSHFPGLACTTAHFFDTEGKDDAIYTQGLFLAASFCEQASPLLRD